MLFVPDPSVERVRPPQSTARHWLGWAGLASVLLHAAMFGVVLWWMRAPRVVLHPVGQPATVQLVMSPPGSDHNAPSTAASAKGPQNKPGAPQPAKPTPPKPKTTAVQKSPTAKPLAAKESPVASQTSQSPQSHLAPQKPQPVKAAPPKTAPAETAVAAQPASHSFAMNLGAVESDTNAWVTGNNVVPPSPDIKFHNRKPSYPAAAALRGEQGTVVLLVHVRPDGLVSGVEVERSSGYARLDDSARDAVQSWHFLPSIENGEPIGSVVPVRVAYVLD